MTYRYHVSWVGSYAKRVKKGIDIVNPDDISFLIESSTETWKAFQEESLTEILKDFGKAYENHTDIVRFPHHLPQDYLQGEIFRIIFNMIREKQKVGDVQITIDVTAAPKMVTYILTFLAMALSTKDSPIKILYTPKSPKSYPLGSDPAYYAPKGSKFCQENGILLADYRTLEKEDPGEDTMFVELPITDFEIFNESSVRSFYLLSLFIHIPNSKSEPITSSELLEAVMSYDKELTEEYASEAEKSEETRNKAVHTKLSLALQQFEKWGVARLSRRGRWFLVNKTWAGDMISPVVTDLYQKRKKAFSKKRE